MEFDWCSLRENTHWYVVQYPALETQYAMTAAMESVVGIGVPSKYFDFPVLSLGRAATVTLNLAKRVRPQRTKKVRRR
jgi:hypothetical protein